MTEDQTITDEFHGDTPELLSSISALISLDEKGALVPHGIGGHARSLLSAAYVRLSNGDTISYSERLEYERRILEAEMRAERFKNFIPLPSGMGGYNGDTYYPVGGTEATHRWNDPEMEWEWLPEFVSPELSPPPPARFDDETLKVMEEFALQFDQEPDEGVPSPASLVVELVHAVRKLRSN